MTFVDTAAVNQDVVILLLLPFQKPEGNCSFQDNKLHTVTCRSRFLEQRGKFMSLSKNPSLKSISVFKNLPVAK